MMSQRLRLNQEQHDRLTMLLGVTMLGVATLMLVATGALGVGRVAWPQYDFALYYAAGLVWLEGGNPYDVATFAAAHVPLPGGSENESLFAYPPTFAPMAMAFAALPFEMARQAIVLINLVAIAVLAALTVRLATDAEEPRPASGMTITPWLLAAAVVGNLFGSRLIWLGQITPVVAALLVSAWYLVRRERVVLAGVLLGLATIKPQFLVLPVLWLALDRQWRALAIAAAVALLLAAYPLALDGPTTVIGEWLRTLALYEASEHNRPGISSSVIGLPGLVVALGGPEIPVFAALAVAMAITAGLGVARARLHADDILGILLALQLGLVYGRGGDPIFLAPAIAALWLHAAHRPKLWPWLGGLGLLLFLPNRIMEVDAAPWLVQWLTPTTLLILATLVLLSLRSRPDVVRADRRPLRAVPRA